MIFTIQGRTSIPIGQILRLGSMAMALSASNPAVAGDQLDFYNFFSSRSISGVPAGIYNSWTEDDRREGWKAVMLGCMRMGLAAMMGVAQQDAAKDRTKEEIQTLNLACVARHLPQDHPAKLQYERDAMQHYEIAKSLGSTFPPPAFQESTSR